MNQIAKNKFGFHTLDPNHILELAEENGFNVTGELTQLNSYENRVFDIRIESNVENINSIIAKFYRPKRWSKQTILDEHSFIQELKCESLEVAQALKLKNESTLDFSQQIYFSFFEKVRGRLLQELLPHHFKKLGRWLARLHNIGAQKQATHRGILGPTNDNKWSDLEKLFQIVSPEVVNRYENTAIRLFENLDERLTQFDFIRLHGDLHRGNILEDSVGEFVVVDFDDMLNGPAIQDFWMLLPQENYLECEEFDILIDSYSELRSFPEEQLELIPLLRAYRIINYAIWIMNRWEDPNFPSLFPQFNTFSYWAEETENLERILYTID